MCTSALSLYRQWNDALLNVDNAQTAYESLIDSIRLRKTPSCADIQKVVQARNTLRKAMETEDSLFARLEYANMSDPTFKGKSHRISNKPQRKPPATVLKQVYGTNRKLRSKNIKVSY